MTHRENGQNFKWLQSVFDQFEAPLVSYAARLVGDADRGRDVVQDVFLRLCRQGSNRPRDHMAAWLYTTCRNRALDICKKERRMTAWPPHATETADVAVTDPASAAEQQEDAHRANAALDCLPKNQQEVIRLKIEHGLKYREIAEVTGLSISNVGYLLHHALHTLRRQLVHPD